LVILFSLYAEAALSRAKAGPTFISGKHIPVLSYQ